MHPVEEAMLAVVSIDDPMDWSPSGAGKPEIERVGRIVRELIRTSHHPGWAMRGVSLALATSYEDHHLERGMASCLRAIRNAFASRRLIVRQEEERATRDAGACLQ